MKLPSPDRVIQWLLDIPERYHSELGCASFQESQNLNYAARVQFIAPAEREPQVPYPALQLRYCYYLHFGEAKMNRSNEQGPLFTIPGKARWVLVRRYLHNDWAQIYQLTSEDVTENERQKQFHLPLGKVVPKSQNDSYVQCILERYPNRLMREAERDYKKTKRKFDLETTRGLIKKIDAASPDHWMIADSK